MAKPRIVEGCPVPRQITTGLQMANTLVYATDIDYFLEILEYGKGWSVAYIEEMLQNPASSVQTKLHSFYHYFLLSAFNKRHPVRKMAWILWGAIEIGKIALQEILNEHRDNNNNFI